jgi:hypothetical protein
MTIDHAPTDEDLNAYVDGELSAHERARVAQAIAANPALAERVATLSRLKSTVAGLAEGSVLTLDSLHLAKPRHRLPTAMVAASILAFSLIAGIIVSSYSLSPDNGTAPWVGQAKSLHLAWLGETASPYAREDFTAVLHKARQLLGRPALIPDMSSAKLTLSGIVFVGPQDGNVVRPLQLRYTGQHNCHVSLWLSPDSSVVQAAMVELNDGHSRGFYWNASGINYALFASGMDHKRLTLLARNVFEATRDRHSPPIHDQEELRVATKSAAPCRA